MLTIAGGNERTLEEFVSLGATTSWKLEISETRHTSAFVLFLPLVGPRARPECEL